MQKIALIGAGSYGFTFKLFVDITGYEALADSEFVFMDVDQTRLDHLETIIGTYMRQQGLNNTVSFTRDRKQALGGANFVINMVKIGFLEHSHYDMDVPKKFGLLQTIGDTCGVGGVFRALRTMPFNMEMAKEMEEVSASGAVILNYTNPQSMLVMANTSISKVPFIGLCHNVQGTSRAIAKYLDVPYEELEYDGAGINHMVWLTTLKHKGRDLYPRLKELVAERGIYGYKPEGEDAIQPSIGPSRFDMLQRIGYVVTESSTHFPEYMPYYLRSPEMIGKYKIPIDQYRDNISRKEKQYLEMYEKAKRGEQIEQERSVEYGSTIINSMVTDTPAKIYANVMNTGLVTNLPEWTAVEIKCLVDKRGVQPVHYGKLPTQLAALCSTNINVYQLAVEAILEKNREKVYWALMLDPHTRTMLDLDQMKQVTDELIEAHGEYLRGYLT